MLSLSSIGHLGRVVAELAMVFQPALPVYLVVVLVDVSAVEAAGAALVGVASPAADAGGPLSAAPEVAASACPKLRFENAKLASRRTPATKATAETPSSHLEAELDALVWSHGNPSQYALSNSFMY